MFQTPLSLQCPTPVNWDTRGRYVPYMCGSTPNAKRVRSLFAPLPTFISVSPSPPILVGNKAWGALLGKVLKARGVMCVMPDYRNCEL